MKIYEARIEGASGGFGMFQRGELYLIEGANDIDDWLFECANIGIYPVPDDSLDGKIYDQNGGKVFRLNPDDPDDEARYSLVIEIE